MRYELWDVAADARAQAAALRALVPSAESVAAPVAQIIATVRGGGDAAVRRLTERFDCPGIALRSLRVDDQQLADAGARLAPELRAGLELAAANVRRVALAAEQEPSRAVELGTHRVTLRREPVERAAVYVPGGRAPYPSTVVMGVVTALAAGVPEVVVCSPPRADGEIDATVLAACALTKASAVYRMGGAQAVAALAYGTDTVAAADVVVGPGNLYVQEAKRQLSGQVAIDGFAGPSDLVLLADGEQDPVPLALDLLAQAEHGSGTLVVAISTSRRLLEAIATLLEAAPDGAAEVVLVRIDELEQGLELAQELAPEHLQLIGPRVEPLAPRITRAGCLLVGAASGTAFGDYITGSNHILPTGGAARFSSGVTTSNFQRSFAEVRVQAPAELARAAAPLARAESFEYHARSMEARIRDNGGDEPQR